MTHKMAINYGILRGYDISLSNMLSCKLRTIYGGHMEVFKWKQNGFSVSKYLFFCVFLWYQILVLVSKLVTFVISTYCSCFNDNSSIKNIFLSQLFLFLYFYFFVNSKQLFTNFVGFSNASQHILFMENPL